MTQRDERDLDLDVEARPGPALDALSDEELRSRIDDLVDERERRMQRSEHDATARLDIELDQLWDLLRQRRALRDAGVDPAQSHVRPASVVEGYQQ